MSTEDIFWIQVYGYIRKKKYSSVIDLLDGPSEKQDPDILFCRGYCFLKERRYLKSLKYLTLVIKKRPDHFRAMKYAGLAHFKLGNLRRCIYYWSHALNLNQQDALLTKYYPMILKRLEKQKVLMGQKQLQEN